MLNAAQSGAIAKNLDHEVDYLIERKKKKSDAHLQKVGEIANDV